MKRLKAFLGSTPHISRPSIRVGESEFDAATIQIDSNEQAIQLLNQWASFEATSPFVLKTAKATVTSPIVTTAPLGTVSLRIATAYHAMIRDGISYAPEAIETFRSPEATMTLGAGDCDDHALLFTALCLASGVPARVVGLKNASGAITHAVGQAYHRDDRVSDPYWHWAETTVKAEYGEHPKEAVRRLKSGRGDIA